MVLATLAAALLGALPSFHLVLSDGNDQLNGQKNRIAQTVARHFQEMGIEVSWSFDPSDPSIPATNVVKVMVLPISSADWKLPPGVLAAVRRESESKAVVGVFYPEVERVLGVRQAGSTHSLQGWKPPGRRIVHGVARVVVHEILHYFLPGRPHDSDGVFTHHVGGNLLARSTIAIRSQTRDALVAELLWTSRATRLPIVSDGRADVEPQQAAKQD
jgi:hypothetical protein